MSFDHQTTDPSAYEREFRRIVRPLMVQADAPADATRRNVQDAERTSARQVDLVGGFEWSTPSRAGMRRVREVRFDAGGIVASHGYIEAPTPLHADISAAIEEPRIGFSIYYRIWWIVLGTAGMVWGAIVGASAAGAGIVGLVPAVVGVMIIAGLMATLFAAGRRSRPSDG